MALMKRLFGTAPDWIEPDALLAEMNAASPPLIVDVRGAEEFSGPLGHIGGARNIPLDRIAGQAADLIKEGKRLVLVCHTDRRSSAAAQMLGQAGGTEISVLRGGMVAWRALNP